MSIKMKFKMGTQRTFVQLPVFARASVLYPVMYFLSTPLALKALAKKKDRSEKPEQKINCREARFLEFASVEIGDTAYMTPSDFLDSIVNETPKLRSGRRQLSEAETSSWLRDVPSVEKGSSHFLRTAGTNEPRSGFSIAFKMMDTDGNSCIDANEFLVVKAIMLMPKSFDGSQQWDRFLIQLFRESIDIANVATKLNIRKEFQDLCINLEEIYSGRKKCKAPSDTDNHQSFTSDESRTTVHNTTLLVHLFGPHRNRSLRFEQFCRFADNLQEEVLSVEFGKFSGGKSSVSEEDFARLLLRYAVLKPSDYEMYIKRAKTRSNGKDITFDQFRLFSQFLNNLDDFAIAIKLYTMSDLPITQDEFARAVKAACGFTLDQHIINCLFDIFDVNEDHSLSFPEFTCIMKDRINRGFRKLRSVKPSSPKHWESFKSCVHDELKKY